MLHLSHHLSPQLSCSQTWYPTDLPQKDIHPNQNFGRKLAADHTVGILFSHAMDTMYMDPLISAAQAKRQDIYQDTVATALDLVTETIQGRRLHQLLWCGHHNQDSQTLQGVAIFLVTLAVCCFQRIILRTVKNQTQRLPPQLEFTEHSKFQLKFSCHRLDTRDRCPKW